MKICIYGATGVTGGLIAEALAGRAELVLIGRDARKLEAVAERVAGAELRVAAVDDRRALGDAVAGARVVLGCAGPFARIGEPVLEAALAAGAHYLDTAGEQAFVRAMYERHEAAARRAGVCAISAMAFEVAPGDLAAALAAATLAREDDGGEAPVRTEPGDELAADDPLDELTVSYLLDRFAPTPGTARSARASLAEPGVVWRNGHWNVIAPAAERRRVDGGPAHGGARDAMSFPSAEVITVPRHVATARVQTFVSLERSGWLARAAGLLSPALPLLSRVMPAGLAAALAEPDAADPEARATAAIAGRAAATFLVIATARRRAEEATVTVSGRDVYATTAAITAWAALALADRGAGPCGVLAPAEAFAPRAALVELARVAGMEVTTTPS